MSMVRVAYIGCGAVTERSHLPALQTIPEMQATVLIDANLEQAKRLAQQYNIDHYGTAVDDFYPEFDCAVVATPSGTHAELGEQLLVAGKHVLIEKPLAINSAQATQLMTVLQQQDRVLTVGLIRRLLPHYRLFKSLLQQQLIGPITRFEVEEGAVFNWPVQSTAFYCPQKSGGGVLMDTGAHLLDACLWWFGDYQTVSYADDSLGGVEADCELRLTLRSGITGDVRMSRLRQLSNQVTVYSDRGSIAMHLLTGVITLSLDGEPGSLIGKATMPSKPPQTTVDLFSAQYAELYSAIKQNNVSNTQLVSADQAIKSVQLIEACYQQRRLLDVCQW